MNVFKKIMTAVRGGAREAGEAIVDANAIRILEQEIKDAENHMEKAKRDLTDVMAKQMQAERELRRNNDSISEHEGYAIKALDKGDEALALEVAEKIATLESEKHEQQEVVTSFASHSTRLKELVRKSERLIKDHQRQLSMVKTTESVQKATAAITDNFAATNSKMSSAKESLERIKKRQVNFEDRLKAAEALEEETSDKGLQDKLKAAGIGEQDASAQSVLARLKSKS
ncbi:MAG: PspA/IM30 family protein [Pseudomonadales bacterium]|nr:PspA/IM30 family protein [Pseudomonadales bacterium]